MQHLLLMAVVMVYWLGLYIFVPVLSPYAGHLGADLSLIGLVVGSYGFTQLLLRLPIGWFSDRLGARKPFVAAGFVITAFSSLLMYFAPSPWYLVIGRGLSGIGAAMWVTLTVLVAGTYAPGQAVAAMSLVGFANNFGMVIGTGASGWIAGRWGWGAPFLVSVVVALIGLVLLIPVVEKREEGRRLIRLIDVKAMLTDRRLLLLSVLSGLIHVITWSTSFGFTLVYAASIGASKGDLGWLTVAGLIPQAGAALLSSRLAGRLGTNAVLVSGMLIMAFSSGVTPYTSSLAMLIVVQMWGGIGRGLTGPMLMGLSIQKVPEGWRAMAMGIHQSIYASGMFLGPLLAGAIGRAMGTEALFLSVAGIGLLAAAVTMMSRSILVEKELQKSLT